MSCLKSIEDHVSAWPNVSVHPHRFGGKEFRFGRAEIGHLHMDGALDIPFPRAVRDALIADGEAEEHRWVPDSGWTTFRVRSSADLGHAVELMRISYLRYTAKTVRDLRKLLKEGSEATPLNSRFVTLLERFLSAHPSNADGAMTRTRRVPSIA